MLALNKKIPKVPEKSDKWYSLKSEKVKDETGKYEKIRVAAIRDRVIKNFSKALS